MKETPVKKGKKAPLSLAKKEEGVPSPPSSASYADLSACKTELKTVQADLEEARQKVAKFTLNLKDTAERFMQGEKEKRIASERSDAADAKVAGLESRLSTIEKERSAGESERARLQGLIDAETEKHRLVDIELVKVRQSLQAMTEEGRRKTEEGASAAITSAERLATAGANVLRLEKELEVATARYAEKEAAILELQTEMVAGAGRELELTSAAKKLDTELNDAKKATADALEKIVGAEGRVETSDQKNKALALEANASANKVTRLDVLLAEAKADIAECISARDALQKQLRVEGEAKTASEAKVRSTEVELAKSVENVRAMQDRLDAAQQGSSNESKILSERVAALVKENTANAASADGLRVDIDASKLRETRLMAEARALEGALQEAKKATADAERRSEDGDRESKRFAADMAKTVVGLESQIATKTTEIARAISERDVLQTQFDEERKQKIVVDEALVSVRKALIESEGKNANLRVHAEETSSNVAELTAQMEVLVKQNAAHEENIANTKKALSEQITSTDAMKELARRTGGELETAREIAKDLEERLATATDKVNELSKQLIDVNEQRRACLVKLEEQKADCTKAMDKLKQAMITNENRNTKLDKQKREAEAERDACERDKTGTEAERDVCNRDKESLQQRLDDEIAKKAEMSQSASTTSSLHQKRIDELELKNSAHVESVRLTKEMLDAATGQVQNTVAALTAMTAERDAALQKASESDGANANLRTAAVRGASDAAEVTRLKKVERDMQGQFDTAQDTLRKLQKTLSDQALDHGIKIATLTARVQELQQTIQDLRIENGALEKSESALKTRIFDAAAVIKERDKTITYLGAFESRANDLKKANAILDQEKQKILTDKQMVDMSLKTLTTTNTQQTETIRQLKLDLAAKTKDLDNVGGSMARQMEIVRSTADSLQKQLDAERANALVKDAEIVRLDKLLNIEKTGRTVDGSTSDAKIQTLTNENDLLRARAVADGNVLIKINADVSNKDGEIARVTGLLATERLQRAADVDALNARLQKLQRETDALYVQISTDIETEKQMKTTISDKDNEIVRVTELLTDHKAQLNDLDTKYGELDIKFVGATARGDNLKKRTQELESRITDMTAAHAADVQKQTDYIQQMADDAAAALNTCEKRLTFNVDLVEGERVDHAKNAAVAAEKLKQCNKRLRAVDTGLGAIDPKIFDQIRAMSAAKP